MEEEENIIYYYDELYLNTYDVVVLSPIKLDKDNETIFIEYIDYELRNKKGKVKNHYKYDINLTIHLGLLYNAVNLYYMLSDRHQLKLNWFILKEFILFNDDLINDFIIMLEEDKDWNENIIKLSNKILCDLNEVILYHIHKGMNKYNIKSYYIDEKRYEYLIKKLNK